MPTPGRPGADALASELEKLPVFISSAALDPIQIAIARAVASGQSADQLASDLGSVPGWQSVDLSQSPNAALGAKTTHALETVKTAAPAPAAGAAPPAWIATIVPIALAKDVPTRVAVLDREPSALSPLQGPAWARGLAAAAVYGPISVASPALQTTVQKWIVIYHITETIEFVRSGVVLCVVPLSFTRLGLREEVSVASGSAWVAVPPIDSSAPAGTFAGFTIQSGSFTSDQALTYSSTTATVPAGASLSLTLVPAAEEPGPSGFPASVTPPGNITVNFPASGTATITFDTCAGTVYGQAMTCTAQGSAIYNPLLQVLYLPGKASAASFAPTGAAGKLFTITGSAPVAQAGWALVTAQSTTPASLGTASGPGMIGVVLGSGLSARWTGIGHKELEQSGGLLASDSQVIFYLVSGAPPGMQIQQTFQLWDDQATDNTRRCQLTATRTSGQTLLYGLEGNVEVLELGASMQALLDRPVLATGARVPASFLDGLVILRRSGNAYRVEALSIVPATPPQAYPMALDNGYLDVSAPQAIYMYADTNSSFKSTEGELLLLFAYLLVELYLPDPYTGGLQAGITDGPPATFATGQTEATESVLYGYLIAEVIWPTVTTAQLRLGDTAHTHPAAPPTSEASSNPIIPMELELVVKDGTAPLHPVAALAKPVAATPANLATSAAAAPDIYVPPPVFGPPLPEPQEGALLLDLSTRASQFGVEVILGDREDLLYTIDGLSVRGPAQFLPLATLPAIAWEPMYDLTVPPNDALLTPPNDGPVCQVRANSATLIPVAPLQSLQAVLDAGTGGFTAQLTLPFGMVALLADGVIYTGTVLPSLDLVQPSFPASSTPGGSIYTGAWQLSFNAPASSGIDPILAGATYLRTQDDNPASPALSYGEQVLGEDVSLIFESKFDPANPTSASTPGVPLIRYDLTGYGASTFSEWTNTAAATTDVIKSFFHVLVGRTSHEVIQVQSIIYPWAVRVVRTITIDRQGSGVVQRYDSGWQAASDGYFAYDQNATGISADPIHPGVVSGVINVKNIQELGSVFSTPGTEDKTGAGTPGNPAAVVNPVNLQPVTFDADVVIQGKTLVVQGGLKENDLSGATQTCVPSTGITGYIGLTTDYHLTILQMNASLGSGAGGPLSATLNLGGASSLLRATSFDATPVLDTGVSSSPFGIVGAIRGVPKLSSDGAWSVGAHAGGPAAPVPLGANQPVPVIQPNVSGSSTIGTLLHYADPENIFRLDGIAPQDGTSFYGFLQSTGTQSNFLARPILTVGSQLLTLGDALSVAHAGALLGAINSLFPSLANCLQFLSSGLSPILNQLESASFSTTQNLYLPSSYSNLAIPLINTSIAQVNLYFSWPGGPPLPSSTNGEDATVVISLGQSSGPSWSLDINQVGIGLVIPALYSDPILALTGSFHADADTLPPSFPNLSVNFYGPMQPIAKFIALLQNIVSQIAPGSGGSPQILRRSGALAPRDDGDSGPGLDVHFSDGKLTVSDTFTLPDIPLGPGTISDISLGIGTTLDIIGLSIDFLVSIGTPDAPCHWIVDPLSGTFCLQAGVQSNSIDFLIQAGIGVGLSLDLGIASGSASIVIAVSIQIQGANITLMLLLTGQASVDVLDGLASASITLTAGLGLSYNPANSTDVDLIGTASVGIHISICWVVNISWSGSWTFQKEVNLLPI